MAVPLLVLLAVYLSGISGVSGQCSGFACRDGNGCLASSQYCDFIPDCSDKSDEEDCSTEEPCDFQNGLCGWTQSEDDDFDWRLRDGSNTPPGYGGPASDHTSGSLAGRYLYLDGSYTNVSSKSTLVSPTFSLAARTCRLGLWYHFFGVEYGDLEVRMRTSDGTVKHLNKVLDKFPALLQWFYGEIWIDPCVENFQILLIGEDKQRTQAEGGIAIDDVAFKDCGFGPGTTGSCGEGYSKCAGTNVCYSDDYQCDFTTDCCQGAATDESGCESYKRCDFEDQNICDWTQLDDDEFDWRIHKGSTGSDNTGPDFDHTLGTVEGHYIYIEISNPIKIFDSARIASFVIAGSPTDCKIRFWYHVKGNAVGALTMYTRQQEKGPLHRVWRETQDQRDQWLFNVIELDRPNDFQVVFEGNRGISVVGDLALDDISFSPGCVAANRNLPVHSTIIPPFTRPPGGTCAPTDYKCNFTRECVRGDARCDFHYDCLDGSDEAECPVVCSFELGYCYWTQAKFPEDDMDWQIRDSAGEMDFNGPAYDHTSNSPQGNYIYVVGGTLPDQGRTARLVSPRYAYASRACKFTFWYNMFGIEYGDLEVFIRTNADGERKLRKELDGFGQYGQWNEGEADIDACTRDFQIILQVQDKLVVPVESGFAVDDILFVDCEVPLPSSGGACSTTEAQCSSGQCYPASQQCDFALDCCDGTDEEVTHCYEYTMCDFENGMCGWSNLQGDEFDWMRNKGSTGTGGTGPGKDHTLGTSEGYYMYIEVDRPRRPGDRARLGSYYILRPLTEQCSIRFFYHMEGIGIGALNIYTRTQVNGPLTQVWSKAQESGDNWYYASVGLGLETAAFQVVIEAVRGYTNDGDIAIDDISFTPGCQDAGYDIPVVSTVAYTGTQSFTPCEDNEFLCYEDYSCVPNSRVCDGAWDCPQGSDEDQGCSSKSPSNPDSNSNALAISLGVIFGIIGVAILAGMIFLLIKGQDKSSGLIEEQVDPYKSQSEI